LTCDFWAEFEELYLVVSCAGLATVADGTGADLSPALNAGSEANQLERRELVAGITIHLARYTPVTRNVGASPPTVFMS